MPKSDLGRNGRVESVGGGGCEDQEDSSDNFNSVLNIWPQPALNTGSIVG